MCAKRGGEADLDDEAGVVRGEAVPQDALDEEVQDLQVHEDLEGF